MYYLKNEQQCFIRFKTTSAARASGFRPDKTRDGEFFKWLQKRIHTITQIFI